MKRALVVLSILIVSSSLAGCIEEMEKVLPIIQIMIATFHGTLNSLTCRVMILVREGTVEFTGSDGTTEKMEQFSSEKKYVLLDNSIS